MGGGAETQTTIVRNAPYLEEYHLLLLNYAYNLMSSVGYNNPYKDYEDIGYGDALYGVGYTISSFPSLYDMFGKFMAGLDIEVLYDEIYSDLINGSVVQEMISQEASILEDEIEDNVLPRFEAGMRDINAVMSSTFVVGEAHIEAERVKAISRFSADIRGKLLSVVVDRWKSHLSWNREVVEMYAQIMKFAIITEMDVDSHNLEMHSRDALWIYNGMQYLIHAISATSGATNTTSELAGASKTQKAIGSALTGAGSGAAMGAMFGASGGPIGAGVGALVGLAYGLLS